MTIDSVSTLNQFNLPKFSASDIGKIKASSSRDHIGTVVARAWDHVIDWFCETNRTEAKKCLFDLFSPLTSDLEKIEIFQKLQNLAGKGFQQQFTSTNESEKESYAIKLADGSECFSLSRTLLRCDSELILKKIAFDRDEENLLGVLEKDITRGTYRVSGQRLDGASTDDRMTQLYDKLAEMGCTAAQKNAIVNICNQSVFGIIMDDVLRSQERIGTCPGNVNARVEYDINVDENGNMRVLAQSLKDIASSENEEKLLENLQMIIDHPSLQLSKSVDISIEIAIGQNGDLDLQHVHYKCNDNPQATTAIK